MSKWVAPPSPSVCVTVHSGAACWPVVDLRASATRPLTADVAAVGSAPFFSPLDIDLGEALKWQAVGATHTHR